MKHDASNTALRWGIVAGLLLAFGIATGIATYINGPGRLPLRTIGVGQSDEPLPPWPDPNAGMQYPQDRLKIAELIKIQDEENAALRSADAVEGGTGVTSANESATGVGETFEIELRKPNPKQDEDDSLPIR